MEELKKQLFLSKYHFPIRRIKEVKNSRYYEKPIGGFWTSSFIDSGYGSEWVQFYLTGFPESEYPVDRKMRSTLFTVNQNARIFVVDSYDDLLLAYREYPLGENRIDFEKLSNDYDAFHVTSDGLWKCRWPEEHDYPKIVKGLTLKVWDVESTIWFRWCFSQVEYLPRKAFNKMLAE